MLILCIDFVQKPRTRKRLARVEIFATLFLMFHIFRNMTL